MADTVSVTIALEDKQASETAKKFQESGIPLTLDYRRVGLHFYWEAGIGQDSFAVTPETAGQDNFNPATARGFKTAGDTPDEAVRALGTAFRDAMARGEIVGYHSRKGPDIDTIRFVGETGGAPKVVALANYYQGKPTHPFTML